MGSIQAVLRAAALAAVLCAIARSGYGQSILQFDRWMQRIERRSQSVQRHITARDAPSAVADARDIGELYRLMEDYFQQRGDAAEAVRISNEGATLADAVVKSLESRDYEAASRSAISIARACRDCHFQYKPLDP
jgi:hypothetical protein